MKTSFVSLGIILGSALSVQAATIDFSGPDFASTFVPLGTDATGSTTVDGVDFSFVVTARGADGFRQSFDNAGLQFGVGGNGMETLAFTASEDILLSGLAGQDRSVDTQTTVTDSLPFDIAADGSVLASDATFAETGSTLDFGDLLLGAGQTFFLSIDLSGVNDGVRSAAVLTSLDFETVPTSPVPLPAGLPLALFGLASLGMMRRRKT